MAQNLIYHNLYDQVENHLTRIKFYRYGIADAGLRRFMPSLSPFPTKLECFLRFLEIQSETISEPNPSDTPRGGEVPFISIDGVKISDSDL